MPLQSELKNKHEWFEAAREHLAFMDARWETSSNLVGEWSLQIGVLGDRVVGRWSYYEPGHFYLDGVGPVDLRHTSADPKLCATIIHWEFLKWQATRRAKATS